MTYCQITATSKEQKIKIVELQWKFIYSFILFFGRCTKNWYHRSN